MAKKKKLLEVERLSIRCTKEEKEMIQKVARERGLSLTECTIKLYQEVVKKEERQKNIAAAVCDMQTLLNYLKDHYIENDYIAEGCNRIWEELNF